MIQANINTIVSQAIGILLAAWLISRIGRHQHHKKKADFVANPDEPLPLNCVERTRSPNFITELP